MSGAPEAPGSPEAPESPQAPESPESRAPGHSDTVPVTELVDLAALTSEDRPPTAREIRAALPRGWVLEPDGVTARRDLRLFFREGWILVLGLVLFGAGGAIFFWDVFPRGWDGVLRLVLLVGAVLLAAGVVAPIITRALYKK